MRLPELTPSLADLQRIDPTSGGNSLYLVKRKKNEFPGVTEFVATTPETRAICNDPYVFGLDYTNKLSSACAYSIGALYRSEHFRGSEASTSVLTILRGGLNFGLREALGASLGWNKHSAWYVSAQREVVNSETNSWTIKEDSYRKVFVGESADVVFGDVVATGTSLRHGLDILRQERQEGCAYSSVTFFTIGAPIATEIVSEWQKCIEQEQGRKVICNVVYFEGVFSVAQTGVNLSIKLDGTDLLRRDALMAPEFIESQYEHPGYPIERCTIYDAGSRAFHVEEYLDDVIDYWESVLRLTTEGMKFSDYVAERAPDISTDRFVDVSLNQLCEERLSRLRAHRGGNSSR